MRTQHGFVRYTGSNARDLHKINFTSDRKQRTCVYEYGTAHKEDVGRNGRAQGDQQDRQSVRVDRILHVLVCAIRGTFAGERSGFSSIMRH